MNHILTYRIIGEPEYDSKRKKHWRVPCYCLETDCRVWALYNFGENPCIRRTQEKVIRSAAERRWEKYGKHEFMA